MPDRTLQRRLLDFLLDGPWEPECPGSTTAELAALFEVPVAQMSSTIGDLVRAGVVHGQRLGQLYDRLQLTSPVALWVMETRVRCRIEPPANQTHETDRSDLMKALKMIEQLMLVEPPR